MWPAFIIGLLSEFFNESKEFSRIILKGFASGIAGLIINLVLLLLISEQASSLVGYRTLTLNNIPVEFVLVPFVVAFVAVIVVKSARYFSNMGAATDRP